MELPCSVYICRRVTKSIVFSKFLTEEYGTAGRIKSSKNRKSVQSAIRSCKEKIKLYKETPPNGLFVFVAIETVATASSASQASSSTSTSLPPETGSSSKVSLAFEPIKGISRFVYYCGDRFETEALESMLNDSDVYGFIIVDGNGLLLGTLCGNKKKTIHRFSVAIPNKHRRGGQSQNRMQRLRQEAIHNYMRKVGEACNDHFTSSTNSASSSSSATSIEVKGLILAGSAEMKDLLMNVNFLKADLRELIISTVTIQYGDTRGFNEAINLSNNILSNVRFVQEKKIVSKLFQDLAKGDSKVIYSNIPLVIQCLEIGALKTLFISDSFKILRKQWKNSKTEERKITFFQLNQLEKMKKINFEKGFFGEGNEIDFLEWILEEQEGKKLLGKCEIKIISNESEEGVQFENGIGIAGYGRYEIPFLELISEEEEEEEGDEEDEWF